MRRLILYSLIYGASFCLAGAGSAYAQAPGAGGAGGAGGGVPQRPSSPDMHNPSSTDNPDTASRKVDDKKFVKDAALGGMTEVELGKLATQKGASDGVKQFGQKMVDDHSKANDQLKEVASKDNMEVPASLDPKHQARIDRLSKLDGAAFDKAYIKDQLKDHQEDVHDFQLEAQNGTDPNVKQFAAATLPTLQQHLSMVKDLKKNEK